VPWASSTTLGAICCPPNSMARRRMIRHRCGGRESRDSNYQYYLSELICQSYIVDFSDSKAYRAQLSCASKDKL